MPPIKYSFFEVPEGTPVGVHLHEADDQADIILNGQVLTFPPGGTIAPLPLRPLSNRLQLRVRNSGGFGWKGRFSLYIGNKVADVFTWGGVDVLPADHIIGDVILEAK